LNSKITLYLDKRRKKKSGDYPIKLRVWDPITGDAKLYPTGMDLNEQTFESAWETHRPRKEFQPLRDQLEEIRLRAVELAAKTNGKVFDELDKKLYRPSGSGQNVFYHYAETIAKLDSDGRLGTASSYLLAKKSISNFLAVNRRSIDILPFTKVDADWLENYEKFMVESGRSRTTVGIYLRTLRAIFNTAIELGDIDKELYPFGRRKYVVPSGKRVKKALSKEQLSALFNSKPANEHQEKAKAFFFFSFACNGMNTKDIALLKLSDLKEDSFIFLRAKTLRTTKERSTPITVFLNAYTTRVIAEYGNEMNHGPFVFPILKEGYTSLEQRRKIQAFTRSVNQHIQKLAVSVGLPKDVSTIWARHSFATTAVRNGSSMEFMSEALGHTDQKTTQNYFAGFENEAKKELAKNLMNF
jgi:integrase/recombinase XerD